MKTISLIEFPEYNGVRCLMMPYIQGDPTSLPDEYVAYRSIVESLAIQHGEIGYLTIDESPVTVGSPHRGARAKYGRALHTEAGTIFGRYGWGGGGGWGNRTEGYYCTTLDRDVQILISNNIDDSCAVWDTEHTNTSEDGDIGYCSNDYPYEDANLLKAGEVAQIGIFTPHESLPVKVNSNRQFLRIVGKGVYGREEYFTRNPLI